MNIPWLSRISTKLTLAIALFLLFLVLIVGVLLIRGFKQTETAVANRSTEGLLHLGQQSLLREVQLTADLQNAEFMSIGLASASIASFMQDAEHIDTISSSASINDLTAGPFLHDSSPNRISDKFIRRDLPRSPQLEQRYQHALLLDSLFPGIVAKYPVSAAVYYISVDQYTQYYPSIGLQDFLPPDFDLNTQIFVMSALPENNPDRATVWTPIYVDPAGLGIMTSVVTPIYEDDEYTGLIGMDVPLNIYIEAIQALHPTTSGYALVVAQDGKVIVSPPQALIDLFGQSAGATASITEAINLQLNSQQYPNIVTRIANQEGGIETINIKNQDYFLAHAPLRNLGWSLVFVAPVSEVTTEVSAVKQEISQQSQGVLTTTLLSLGGLMLLALVCTWFLSRRLTQPIVALVQGTQQLADDDQRLINLAVTSKDEFGVLAHSFNDMANRIHDAYQRLRHSNQNLESTIQDRTQELEEERASLQTTLSELQQMTTTVARLTTPVIPVLKGVVVVPVSGTVDRPSLERLQQEVLKAVDILHIHTVIIDVTGVVTFDQQAAQSLQSCVLSLSLVGAKPILVGIQPELAQHLIHSGIDLDTVTTMQTLQVAVESARRS